VRVRRVSEALIYGAWMLAEALSFAPNFAAAKRSGARIVHTLTSQPGVRTEDSAEHLPGWVSHILSNSKRSDSLH
jgi:hypothetical protein